MKSICLALALLNVFAAQSSAQRESFDETSSRVPATQTIASSQPTLTEAETRHIEALIASLRWSGTIGSGHGPVLQIKGNDSAEELARIGAPAVPFLLKALAPDEETNPLATRRNIAAVTVLGEIGDRSAVEGIAHAMDQQWKDAMFQQAAVSALAQIGDESAVPALLQAGQLSLGVCEITLSPERQPAGGTTKPFSTRLEWWASSQHISDANMAVLWTDAFSAIGAISPANAIELARAMSRDGNEFQFLGAVVLARAAAAKDANHAAQARTICETALSKATNPEVKDWMSRLRRELK